jgi:hypothetical protein
LGYFRDPVATGALARPAGRSSAEVLGLLTIAGWVAG